MILSPVRQYISLLTLYNKLYEWGIPLVLSFFFVYFGDIADFNKFRDNSISLSGVLLGFTIAAFTILISTENDVIKDLKNRPYKEKKNLKITPNLHEVLLISFSHLAVLNGLLLMLNIIYSLFENSEVTFVVRSFFFVDVALTMSVVLGTIKSIVNMYFTFVKNR